MEFDKLTYTVKEKDGVLHIPIFRTGDLSYKSSVRCFTRTMSAMVMDDFEERRNADDSRITFQKGEKVWFLFDSFLISSPNFCEFCMSAEWTSHFMIWYCFHMASVWKFSHNTTLKNFKASCFWLAGEELYHIDPRWLCVWARRGVSGTPRKPTGWPLDWSHDWSQRHCYCDPHKWWRWWVVSLLLNTQS